MNYLSKLTKIVSSRKKRLGRGPGSGRGAKSGRGTTRHQASRENIPLHFEGGQGKLSKKFPLLRGKGKNNSHAERPVSINLDELKGFKDNEVVSVESLIKKGIIPSEYKKRQVKILSTGTIEKKLKVKVFVSNSAKVAIEKAGGSVEKS